ncbi:MAG TPA: D-alanine--D-alanine ligase [Anaerolineae bacterium]|nr:D-alanine--D-alanine ligase [Anaerolineae bacterium]
MKNRKLRVGVIFGGKSGEHEISLVSARSIMGVMDREKFQVVPIGIDKQGRWLTQGDPMRLLSDNTGLARGEQHRSFTSAEDRRRELIPGTEEAGFPEVDVVFPVLHGPYGEDGTVQGLLELANIPYVGCGVLASAAGMDKAIAKSLFIAHGLPILPYQVALRKVWEANPKQVLEELEAVLSYPMFVKPANLGSSVGVSKARNRQELIAGLDDAARYDRKLIIEQGIDAREIECSVLGNDEPIASVPGEIVPCNEFYDYEAKYLAGESELLIPAPISPELTEQVQALSVAAFKALDGAGGDDRRDRRQRRGDRGPVHRWQLGRPAIPQGRKEAIACGPTLF